MTTPKPTTRGYGWSPYWAPFLAFMLLIEVGRRAPESAEFAFLVAKVAVPGLLVLYYLARKAYPELLGLKLTAGGLLGDVGIGLLGAALWVAPFVLFDGLRPEAGDEFDPRMWGEAGVATVLGVRFIGYALVTPFVEELFVRSWLLRYMAVLGERKDFRKVPIGQFAWPSFVITTAYFVFSHTPWEWGVMLAWTLLTMFWLYHRKHILSLILVHAVTNGSILALAIFGEGRVRDATGALVDLWFFV